MTPNYQLQIEHIIHHHNSRLLLNMKSTFILAFILFNIVDTKQNESLSNKKDVIILIKKTKLKTNICII